MKYIEAKAGRVFVLRLEDGDILHESVEKLAEKESINAAGVLFVGGADLGSEMVVGPETPRDLPVKPLNYILDNVHEAAGVGTLFRDEEGKAVLHMHAACGRNAETHTGCVRSGVKIWRIGEVIVSEIVDCDSRRVMDVETGFKLLEV